MLDFFFFCGFGSVSKRKLCYLAGSSHVSLVLVDVEKEKEVEADSLCNCFLLFDIDERRRCVGPLAYLFVLGEGEDVEVAIDVVAVSEEG